MAQHGHVDPAHHGTVHHSSHNDGTQHPPVRSHMTRRHTQTHHIKSSNSGGSHGNGHGRQERHGDGAGNASHQSVTEMARNAQKIVSTAPISLSSFRKLIRNQRYSHVRREAKEAPEPSHHGKPTQNSDILPSFGNSPKSTR